jgi:transposase
MSTEALSLPDDVALLKQIILQQHEQLASWQRKYDQLEHRLDVLLRRMFGPRSERVDPNQLPLFEMPADVTTPSSPPPEAPATEASPARSKRRGHGRRQWPANIERRRIPLDIDEKDKTCPCCGKPRRMIGEVVTERMGFEPTRFYINQYVQRKYACPCEQSGVVTAEKPIQPIEKGNAEPELVAYVAVRGIPTMSSTSPLVIRTPGHCGSCGATSSVPRKRRFAVISRPTPVRPTIRSSAGARG